MYYGWLDSSKLWVEQTEKTTTKIIIELTKQAFVQKRAVIDEEINNGNLNNSLQRGYIDTAMKLLGETRYTKQVMDALDLIPKKSDFVEDPPIFNTFPKINDISGWLPTDDGKMFNIFTGETVIRTKKHYFTKTINAHYDENANTTMMEEFFSKLMCEDKELFECLVTTMSIYICGDPSIDKTFCICYGPGGDNGKSVFLNVFENFLGDFAKSANPGVFLKGSKTAANAHSSHLMALQGKLIAFLGDLDEQASLDMMNIKKISGNDTMTGRLPHQTNEISFRPTTHLIVATNKMPKLKVDGGVWIRTLTMPFNAKFRTRKTKEEQPSKGEEEEPSKGEEEQTNKEEDDDEEQVSKQIRKEYDGDVNIRSKLNTPENFNGLLKLLHKYGKKFKENGYTYKLPKEVEQTRETYLQDQVLYRDFINECCVKVNHDKKERGSPTSVVYGAYRDYMNNQNRNRSKIETSERHFTETLKAAGYELKSNTTSTYHKRDFDSSQPWPLVDLTAPIVVKGCHYVNLRLKELRIGYFENIINKMKLKNPELIKKDEAASMQNIQQHFTTQAIQKFIPQSHID